MSADGKKRTPRVFLFKRNKIWFQMLQNFCSILICKSGIQTFGLPGEFHNKPVSQSTFASRKFGGEMKTINCDLYLYQTECYGRCYLRAL